jgi:proteasome accessory factor C
MQRLLAIVPWIAAHDGPTIDEVSERFSVGREALLRDLRVIPFVGTYPYTPDQLIEATIEDDRVWIRYADMFRRPLRLTPAEGLSLVTAGRAVLTLPGADPEGPLASGLAKVAATLGSGPDQPLDVDVGSVDRRLFEELDRAIASHRCVDLDYYSFGRDERTHRVVEPWRLWADQGEWYVSGHCRSAGGERVFRVDRIAQLQVLDETFDPPIEEPGGARFTPSDQTPHVVIDLETGPGWVLENYPAESISDLGEGRRRVVLAVTARPWLERLLLQLGDQATVVDIDPRLGPRDLAGRAAARVLERYQRAKNSDR